MQGDVFEKEVIYIAVFHKEEDEYLVTFPDIEDCRTHGKSIEEAYVKAQEALGCALFDLNGDYPKYITEPQDVKVQDGDFVMLLTPIARSSEEKDKLSKHVKYSRIKKILAKAAIKLKEDGFADAEIEMALNKLEQDLTRK